MVLFNILFKYDILRHSLFIFGYDRGQLSSLDLNDGDGNLLLIFITKLNE